MKVGIIGCGSYGLALSMMFYENTHNIELWTKFEDEKEDLDIKRFSEKLNLKIPNDIKFTTSIKQLVKDKDLIVIAIPLEFINDTLLELKKYYHDEHICIASKGIEQDNYLFAHEILNKHIKTSKLAVISGGTFAIDMVKKVPLGLSVATLNKNTEEIMKKTLQNKYLHLEFTKDILGIEICGAIKNVIAIGSGIVDGLGFPESSRCMLLTSCLLSMKTLIKKLGGNEDSILSYAGFGDFLLTCTSSKSRNYTLGKMIGEKKDRDEINNYIKKTTIEGLYTLKAIYELLKIKKIDIPIISIIYDIVINKKDPHTIFNFITKKST